MDKDKYIIPHYPFYNEPKLVAESQKFVQDVRQLLESIDAEYAMPDELKTLQNDADSMNKVSAWVASKQYGAAIPCGLTLTEQELKAADYYLKTGDKGRRVSLICNELFKKMVWFTTSLDTHAKNYGVDQTLTEEYIKIIKQFHDCVDGVNGTYGNEKELCLCCHSKISDGAGIKHSDSCPLFIARRIIK